MRTSFHRLATATIVVTLSALAAAQGPDVIVSRVGGDPGSDFAEFAATGGIRGYAMGTTSCNIGSSTLLWISGDNRHPVIAQQAYRLSPDGKRFEQLGYAWLKHGFCAVNEFSCGSCQTTSCATLGLMCADTYGSGLNSPPGLGARYDINAATGANTYPMTTFSTGPFNTIIGSLQIKESEITGSGARYFFEGQYVTEDDSASGNHANNCSYREVSMSNPNSISAIGATEQREPAIRAWAESSNAITVKPATLTDEGGMGVHGIFNLGFAAFDNGDGTWDYEYALHNQTSERKAGGFSVPIPSGVNVSNIEFHGVNHHGPGEQASTPWTSSLSGGVISWSTTNNPISWGTLYNFRFTADSPPMNISASISLYEAGTPSMLAGTAKGPMPAAGGPGSAFCFGDGTGNACPCGNTGGSGEGCATTTGSGMTISASGTTSIANDDLVLTAGGVPLGNTGIFYAGETAFAGNPLFDGLQCTGGNVLRFSGQLASSSTVSDTNLVAQDLFGLFWVPGNTYHFQYFTRDNQTGVSPCSGFANLSHGLSVTMTP